MTFEPVRPFSADASPKVRKIERGEALSRVLDRGLAAATEQGATIERIAQDIDESAQRVSDWRRPEVDRHVTLRAVAGMPQVVRDTVAEHLAGPGRMVCELPQAENIRASLTLLTNAQRETSEAVGALLAGIADGRLDRREGAEIAKQAREAIRVLLAVAAAGDLAVREGVVGCDLGENVVAMRSGK